MDTITRPTMYPDLYNAATYIETLVDEFGFEAVSKAFHDEAKLHKPVKYARDSDPQTSRRDGPADVRRFSRHSHSGRLLLAFYTDHLTDSEATDLAMRDRANVNLSKWEGCRRRCSDLRLVGYIEDTHEIRDGRIVWKITERGADAVAALMATGWSC